MSHLWHHIIKKTIVEKYLQVKLIYKLADSVYLIIAVNLRVLNSVTLVDSIFSDMVSDQASLLVSILGVLLSASLDRLPYPGEDQKVHRLYKLIYRSALIYEIQEWPCLDYLDMYIVNIPPAPERCFF